MEKWLTHVQVNSEDVSRFIECWIEVPDEQFVEMNKAVEEKRPLKELNFYDDLVDKAMSCIDFSDYIDYSDKPERSDYDSEEEYNEDLQYFNEEIESALDMFCIARVDVDDPGDFQRFKEKFIGRNFEDEALVDLEENDERYVMYLLSISVDNGVISDVEVVSAEAMEYDGVKGGSFDSCYPDYDLLAEELEKYLS